MGGVRFLAFARSARSRRWRGGGRVEVLRSVESRRDTHRGKTQKNHAGRGRGRRSRSSSPRRSSAARGPPSNALPNVLNNYDADSLGATVARLGTGVAILSGFPLMFAGLKAALDGCFKLRGPAGRRRTARCSRRSRPSRRRRRRTTSASSSSWGRRSASRRRTSFPGSARRGRRSPSRRSTGARAH